LENEILEELEKLQGDLNDERALLHESIDLRMNLLENQIIRLRKKIEDEQEKMGAVLELEALERKNKGGD